jgi:hypothetical protein
MSSIKRTANGLSPSIEVDAEHLLQSDDFSKAQYGMGVESVRRGKKGVSIRTTGGIFEFDPNGGFLKLSQRLGMKRSAASVTFPAGFLDGLKVEGSGSGSVRLSAGRKRLQLRVNGDSLLMLRSSEPLSLTVSVDFVPAVVRQYAGNTMFMDEYGVIGAYPATGGETAATVTVSGHSRVRYDLAAVSSCRTVGIYPFCERTRAK